MHRSTFLKSLAAMATIGTLPLAAHAADEFSMLLPANPGGGWDSTGRALGQALVEAGGASTISFENKGGNSGAIGLAQFVKNRAGDPHALMMMGAVMLGGIIAGKPPLSLNAQAALDLSKLTPLARLTSEYNVFVLPANSPFKSMADVVAQLKKDPASVKWGGGSRGATEQLAIILLARAVGVDPTKIHYVEHSGGGEAAAAIMRGDVTIGGSGLSEFASHIAAGKMHAIGLTSPARLKNVNIPTMLEQGYKVEIGNWRGVYGAAGISTEQRRALVDKITQATRSPVWLQALEKNAWAPAFLSGADFDKFVSSEFRSMSSMMSQSGMV